METLILIRYDEIAMKGKNRPEFIRRLVGNIRRATGLPKHRVQIEWGRIYIDGGQEADRLVKDLQYVFGIKNLSLAVQAPLDFAAVERSAVELAQREVERGAKTFKVEARRSFKSFPLNSMEINARLGRTVLDAIAELKVDVHHPDFRIEVEVRAEGVFLCTRRIEGPGGLPVGINGRALLLLSGGIDSPVAGWMLMKRGLAVDAIYFHSFPYTGEKAKEKVTELSRILSRWKGDRVLVYVPHFTDVQLAISAEAPPPLWTVLHRRFMHRIAETVARANRYGAIATGESLGQVASQTLENLACIDGAISMLVLRPLIGFDKSEIVEMAKRIGTYETSILPYEDCCTLFAPQHPETRARKERVEQVESQLDSEKLIQKAIEQMEVYSVNGGESAPVRQPPSKTSTD